MTEHLDDFEFVDGRPTPRTREIAKVAGVGNATVFRARAAVPNETPDEPPARVVGADLLAGDAPWPDDAEPPTAAGATLQRSAGLYRVTWPGTALEFRALDTSGHAVYALAVAHAGDRVLPETGINLTNDKARQALAAAIERLRPGPDWRARVDDAVRLVLGAYREGDPAVDLAELPAAIAAEPWLVAPLLVRDEPTILYGDGGTHKSRTALLLAGTVAAGRTLAPGIEAPTLSGAVIYADWEQTAQVARGRLADLCDGRPPSGVVYVRCARPFVHEAERLGRIAMDSGAVLLVLDSVGFGLSGSGNDDDVAASYFRELRGLGLTSLLIHHTPKTGDPTRPYGSAYWTNGSRLAWQMQTTPGQASDCALVTMVCRKRNDGPLLSPRGLSYTFADGRVSAFLGDAAPAEDADPDRTAGNLRYLIRRTLETGPQTVAELSEGLDAKPASVRRVLNRYPDTFTHGDGGRWEVQS
jgi:hypothetical protein